MKPPKFNSNLTVSEYLKYLDRSESRNPDSKTDNKKSPESKSRKNPLGDDFPQYIKARNAATKMSQVRSHRPITLSYEDVKALEEYFPTLKSLIESAAV